MGSAQSIDQLLSRLVGVVVEVADMYFDFRGAVPNASDYRKKVAQFFQHVNLLIWQTPLSESEARGLWELHIQQQVDALNDGILDGSNSVVEKNYKKLVERRKG